MGNTQKKRKKGGRENAFEELLNNEKFNASYWLAKSGGPSYGLETDAIVALRRMGFRGSLGDMLRDFYSTVSGESFFISAYVKAVFKDKDREQTFEGRNYRQTKDGETYATFRLDGLGPRSELIPRVRGIEVRVSGGYSDELEIMVYNHDSKALEAVHGVIVESKGIYKADLTNVLQSVIGPQGDIGVRFNEPIESENVKLKVNLVR